MCPTNRALSAKYGLLWSSLSKKGGGGSNEFQSLFVSMLLLLGRVLMERASLVIVLSTSSCGRIEQELTELVKIAVLTPINLPAESRRGPPLLPAKWIFVWPTNNILECICIYNCCFKTQRMNSFLISADTTASAYDLKVKWSVHSATSTEYRVIKLHLNWEVDTRINCRIRLYPTAYEDTCSTLNLPFYPTDHPSRECMVKPKRVAYAKHL